MRGGDVNEREQCLIQIAGVLVTAIIVLAVFLASLAVTSAVIGG